MLPRPMTTWWPSMVDWEEVRRHGPLSLSKPPLNTRFSPSDKLTRGQLRQLIARACATNLLDLCRVDNALRHPASTVRLAYLMTRKAAVRLGINSSEVGLALALFRIAAGPLLIRRQCALCFRVAFPGRMRCRYHTRSKVVEPQGAVQNARTARAIFEESKSIRDEAAAISFVCGQEDRLVGAMFRCPAQASGAWHDAVQLALGKSPLVRDLLNVPASRLGPPELFRKLRQALDPDEYVVLAWPKKIVLAQRWLELEYKVAPGGPPTGARHQTLERVRLAQTMLNAGMDTVAVAAELGISPANLYQILSRYRQA